VSGTNAQQQIFGTAISTTAASGGADGVNAGGHATGTVVSGGGSEFVFNGGVTTGTVVQSGGQEVVLAGGAASNTSVGSGGSETVSSGGILAGATIGGGGIVAIEVGGSAGSSTIAISSGTLVLDDSQHFSGSVAGLATSGAQNVDLVDIDVTTVNLVGYTSGGGGNTSGTLTVSDGLGHTTLLNLIGTYQLNDFHVSDDGHGGTLLTDPPVSSGTRIAPPH